MGELWKVFKDSKTGKELCAYTIRGTFDGEEPSEPVDPDARAEEFSLDEDEEE